MILFIFGDSITQGYWDSEGGWADRLKAAVLAKDIANERSTYHAVYSLGVDGDTTRQVIDRFKNETQARLFVGAKRGVGVIFAVGTNDTLHTNQSGFFSTPEQYEQELTILLQQARELTPKVAFVNLCPVNEPLTNPLPNSSTGKSFTNERINAFNNVLGEFCSTNDVTLINVHDQFMKSSNALADGLHPNAKGHQIIAKAVQPTVDAWLYGS